MLSQDFKSRLSAAVTQRAKAKEQAAQLEQKKKDRLQRQAALREANRQNFMQDVPEVISKFAAEATESLAPHYQIIPITSHPPDEEIRLEVFSMSGDALKPNWISFPFFEPQNVRIETSFPRIRWTAREFKSFAVPIYDFKNPQVEHVFETFLRQVLAH